MAEESLQCIYKEALLLNQETLQILKESRQMLDEALIDADLIINKQKEFKQWQER